MRTILHIVSADLSHDMINGYSLFVDALSNAQVQRHENVRVQVWNVRQDYITWLKHRAPDLYKIHAFENLLQLDDVQIAIFFIEKLKAMRISPANGDEVYWHSPIVTHESIFEVLRNEGIRPHVIVHDLGPILPHDGWLNLTLTDVWKQMDAFKQVLKKRSVNYEKLEGTLHAVEFVRKTFEAFAPDLLLSAPHYYKFCKAYFEFLRDHTNGIIVPSELYQSLFRRLGLESRVIYHPRSLTCTTPRKVRNEVLSVYSWNKFDLQFYLSVVRENPHQNFVLVCSEMAMLNINSIKVNWGLPYNLKVIPSMSPSAWRRYLSDPEAPKGILHISMTVESYGMLLDNAIAHGIPIILVTGQYNSMLERWPWFNQQYVVKRTSESTYIEDVAVVGVFLGQLPKTKAQLLEHWAAVNRLPTMTYSKYMDAISFRSENETV